MARAKKTTTKKTTAKKTTAKKATAKKVAKKTAAVKKTIKKTVEKKAAKVVAKKATRVVAKKAAKLVTTAVKDSSYTKSEILNYIAENTDLNKKQVNQVFETLHNLMERHLKKSAVGEFTVPGLMKCVVKRKPATKARKGTNPFTGEEMVFKAKPARNIIKVRPLKKLKEMAS